MTGRELIIYILENNLEDKHLIFDMSFFTNGLLNIEDVAKKFDVGVETVRAWYLLGQIRGINFGNEVYFPKEIKDPRENI